MTPPKSEELTMEDAKIIEAGFKLLKINEALDEERLRCESLQSRLTRTEAALAEAEKALKLYASDAFWMRVDSYGEMKGMDWGDVAREALSPQPIEPTVKAPKILSCKVMFSHPETGELMTSDFPNLSESKECTPIAPSSPQEKLEPTAEPIDYEAKYFELIMAVERKWPNEDSHQTALKYIRQAENQTQGPHSAMAKESN